MHYAIREEYTNLGKDFLDGRINEQDFVDFYTSLYEGVADKLEEMKMTESLDLIDFLQPNRPELGEMLRDINLTCSLYDYNRRELESFPQKLLNLDIDNIDFM